MENESLTRDRIQAALGDGRAAAFRSVTDYQPAGGPGDKVFPPACEGGAYAMEERHMDGAVVPCVLFDAVQSQANRMEPALLADWRAANITLPVVTVDFTGCDLPRPFAVTSLEAPHRVADALFRDSLLGDVPFRHSEPGARLDLVDIDNGTGLFELCPTALVFGFWDSTGPRGGQGVTLQRGVVSEFAGLHARRGVMTTSRIDPARIVGSAGPIYRTAGGGLSLAASDAAPGGGAGLRPAAVNHGNLTPSSSGSGGVRESRAVQTIVLSLPALRRLRFPVDGATGPGLGPGGPHRAGGAGAARGGAGQATGSGPAQPLPAGRRGPGGLGAARRLRRGDHVRAAVPGGPRGVRRGRPGRAGRRPPLDG